MEKLKNYPEATSFFNQGTQNKNLLNIGSKNINNPKDSNINAGITTLNTYAITNSGLNSSHNDDSCYQNNTHNISVNSNESIYSSSPSKKLNLMKYEKLEDFKKHFELLESFIRRKVKTNQTECFAKLLNYFNSEFAFNFKEFKEITNSFLNSFSLLTSTSNTNDNKVLEINEALRFNSIQIHNYFESMINNLKEKLDLPLTGEKASIKNEDSVNETLNASQEFLAENQFNMSAISEDCLFEYENVRKNTKTNSICLEIPNKRQRSLTENDDSLYIFNSIKGKEKDFTAKENSINFNQNLNEIGNKNLNSLENFEKVNEKNSLKNISFEIDLGKETSNYNDTSSSNLNSTKGKNFELRFCRLNKRTLLSSEEIQKKINEKLEQAEKNKNDLKKLHTESYNKTMMKIKDIKNRKKLEKIEKMQKMYKKIEKFNQRHQEYLNEKISKVKSENEKIAEIKFLLKIDKENKNHSLLKKLDISIDRRKKYIEQKLWKTKLRNKREEQFIKSTNIARDDSSNSKYTISGVNDEIKVKFLKKIQKNLKNEIDNNHYVTIDLNINNNENKNVKIDPNKSDKIKLNNNQACTDNGSSINFKHNQNCYMYKKQKSSSSKSKNASISKNEETNNKCSCNKGMENKANNGSRIIYNQKKQKLEENFEFIRTIYSENFIWELLEADYFDIDELCELSQLTKFELLKSKLKKDKEIIDKLYDNKSNSNLKNDLNKNIFYPSHLSNVNIYSNMNNKISNISTSINNNLNNNNNMNPNISSFNITNNINKKQSTVKTDSVNSFVNDNEKNYFNFEEQILANDSDEKDSFYIESQKKSRSFMHFDENDFIDYEYLFDDNSNKKNKKKKKKKIIPSNEIVSDINIINNIENNSVNNDDTDKIKNKLIKTINSMSQKTISTLYKSINNDNNSKKKNYLLKSKNGKYLKSKIQIRSEESDSENKNTGKFSTSNINKISVQRLKEKENESKSSFKSSKKQQSSTNLCALQGQSNHINTVNNDNINQKKQNEIKNDNDEDSNNQIEENDLNSNIKVLDLEKKDIENLNEFEGNIIFFNYSSILKLRIQMQKQRMLMKMKKKTLKIN